ncbi:uncharacterized protein G2W53_007874 [Senna tora]|uniref:Uncharacterized protein n=1 Tax=Senna tora TaxID=362788 RepID=A0A834X757_9FABA|nr:uncharacterized protein G2W53_007874 [Senna tora]
MGDSFNETHNRASGEDSETTPLVKYSLNFGLLRLPHSSVSGLELTIAFSQ